MQEINKEYILDLDKFVIKGKILDKELEIQHDKVLEKKENNEVVNDFLANNKISQIFTIILILSIF